ncbi:MAG: alanine racemase [Erysipelotrichaceae bacterium]|nr:alanine racemase [Erysipelotrichaceae bacterium]
MIETNKRCWAEINTSNIAHNVNEIRKIIPSQTKIMGIVKANAYGHGDVSMCKELLKSGVDFFGVACMEEALRLRQAHIQERILILGYTPKEQFHYLHEQNLIQTLISMDFAKELSDYACLNDVEIQCHVKVDTGMSRLGVQCKKEQWDIEDVKRMYHLPHIRVQGIFSHFSVSDDITHQENLTFTNHQIALFDLVLQKLKQAGIEPGITHLQNSYGILNYPHLSYDYVRPGLLHLGVTSDDALATIAKPDFRPVMTWKASISYVKWIEAGCDVSYGRTYTAKERIKVATVCVGYADGYPRMVSNMHKHVLIHGQRAEIIGRICMDQMMIDVSAITDVKTGDEVVLFGYDNDVLLSVDELSRACHTINNETLCWLSERVQRIYR